MALGKVLLWHVQNKVLHEIWARLDGGLMPIESFSSSEFFVFDSTFGKVNMYALFHALSFLCIKSTDMLWMRLWNDEDDDGLAIDTWWHVLWKPLYYFVDAIDGNSRNTTVTRNRNTANRTISCYLPLLLSQTNPILFFLTSFSFYTYRLTIFSGFLHSFHFILTYSFGSLLS